ncbi:MAG: hypothetical protein ABIV26_03745 [Candidatus Limnocylindrales bacterium]
MSHDARDENALDDAALGRHVREVASAWEMPPVRLDAATWRDHVRPSQRLAGPRTGAWVARLSRALVAAVALTFGAALIGVWLTRPAHGPAASQPTTGSTDRASQAPAGTPLPRLFVVGDLPARTSVLVQLEQGDWALADLATGSLGSPLTGSSWPTQLRRLPDGTSVCICVSSSGFITGSATRMKVELVTYDGTGTAGPRMEIGDFAGTPDPRTDASPEQPGHVFVEVSFSRDGRYAFVGWSLRDHPVWHNGLIAVDLEARAVVARVDLADGSTGSGDSRQVGEAPRVAGETGGRLIVGRGRYGWSPAGSANPTYHVGMDAFTVAFDGRRLGDPQEIVGARDCGDEVASAGGLEGGGLWLACRQMTSIVVRRVDASGNVSDTPVAGQPAGLDGIITAVSPDERSLYVWNPTALALSRVDLQTGAVENGPSLALADGRPSGAMSSIGRWLVPTAAAKMLLRAGIAVSPDSTRVYGIGVTGLGDGSGSAGIFALDGATLESVWHTTPTADYVSLALSPDGRFLYAAGMPGVNGNGEQTGQQASITVLDTSDGSVRLLAGELGRGLILFPEATLP